MTFKTLLPKDWDFKLVCLPVVCGILVISVISVCFTCAVNRKLLVRKWLARSWENLQMVQLVRVLIYWPVMALGNSSDLCANHKTAQLKLKDFICDFSRIFSLSKWWENGYWLNCAVSCCILHNRWNPWKGKLGIIQDLWCWLFWEPCCCQAQPSFNSCPVEAELSTRFNIIQPPTHPPGKVSKPLNLPVISLYP